MSAEFEALLASENTNCKFVQVHLVNEMVVYQTYHVDEMVVHQIDTNCTACLCTC